jgi:hypothetical protein
MLKKAHQVFGSNADEGKTAREEQIAEFMELIHDKVVEFSDNNRHGRPILDKVRIGDIARQLEVIVFADFEQKVMQNDVSESDRLEWYCAIGKLALEHLDTFEVFTMVASRYLGADLLAG